MPTESFRNLERGVDAWNRRDVDTVMESFTEDVVWRTGGQIPDIESVYKGHEGVRRFFSQFVDPWEEISIEIEDVIEDREDQIVVLVSFHARGREGIEVDGRFFQIYRYDEQHRCRWFQAFGEEDKEGAFREAGLDG
jgi:ketosteroid isomerase-like protein